MDASRTDRGHGRRQLNDQENRLDTVRTQIAEATARRDKARDELTTLVANFTYET